MQVAGAFSAFLDTDLPGGVPMKLAIANRSNYDLPALAPTPVTEENIWPPRKLLRRN
jgi:hypothetical protein